MRYKLLIILLFFSILFNANLLFANNKKDRTVFVFISFSMPDSLIKEYIEEAKQYKNVIFVLRGMIDNNMSKTIYKIKEISNNENIGIIIDPRLYKKFNISYVPTIVEANNVEYKNIDQNYNKISGNITIEYALEIFNRGQ